jgi:hypothetical protein
MIFSKSLVGNSVQAANQFKSVQHERNAANSIEQSFLNNRLVKTNAGLIPQDVYQDIDRVAVEVMHLDDGDSFLNDLLLQSRSINIGKLVHRFNRVSDAGIVETSMSGQIDAKMDQTEISTAGTIVPMQMAAFGRNWREMEAQRSEGYDALIDDTREITRTVRERLADEFLNGHFDKNGNIIVVDGLSWAGMSADAKVNQITLAFDFTDTTKSFALIEAALKLEVRDVMWFTELCSKDLTYYVSDEIASNFERASSESFDSQKILQRLAGLMKIKEIKPTNKLSGNEMMGFPSDGTVQPLVGMGVNTVAAPRPMFNSNFNFVTASAVGWKVKTDFNDNTCAFFAS